MRRHLSIEYIDVFQRKTLSRPCASVPQSASRKARPFDCLGHSELPAHWQRIATAVVAHHYGILRRSPGVVFRELAPLVAAAKPVWKGRRMQMLSYGPLAWLTSADILSKARPGRASVPVSPHSDPFVAVRMWRQASLPDSAGGFQPLAGVWTFSAEITGGTQPAGLAEGSRWSFRARGERPPESCVREGSTQEGCQSCAFVRSIRLRRRSGTPPGCMTCLAPIRRSPPPKILGDLRLPSGNPSG